MKYCLKIVIEYIYLYLCPFQSHRREEDHGKRICQDAQARGKFQMTIQCIYRYIDNLCIQTSVTFN